MKRIFHDTKYDFIRWWRTTTVLTIAFIVAGLIAMAIHGVNYSIEFTGGTLMQLRFKNDANIADIRTALRTGGVRGEELQSFGSNREFTIRVQDEAGGLGAGAESEAQRIQKLLTQRYGAEAFTVVRTEAVGPRVGGELRRGAIIAILISFGITLLYLAFRFEWRFGVAAVLATAHDILTTLAFLALMRIEVSLTVVAGLLTVLGYSLNDTIIIFDRVRENLKKSRKEPLYDILNRSVNETLPRSVLTHATTVAATLALLLFAGEVIRPFAWVMLFGIVTGTFSSIYVASPLLLWIERKWPRQNLAAPTSTGGTSGTRSARTGTDARAARDAHPAPSR
jgi:preprotein translocase subunit SecF